MKKLCMLLFVLPMLTVQAQKWEKYYDYVDECICGLSKVSKNGKVGYADKQGKEVIKLEYNEGLTFNEGYVAVKKGNKWLFLDSTGKAITEAIFDDAMSFENGLAVVTKDGLSGYINHSGKLVIGFQFENARNFTEGLAPASNTKGLWGFINMQGNWVIKPQYGFADNFIGEEARVIKDNKVFYINKDNKVLHE